ncbi:MAG: hypothetical protein IT562_06610 [Alphaproteobacteria bacterium]|nr:hypothetical protein [Alphaproteobacteria bacterium]
MKIAAAKAQIGYEVGIRPPAFDMAANGVNSVKALYATFSPKFNISAADIQVVTQQRLSDFVIRLSAFGGLWTFDMRFEGYSVTCNNLVNDADFASAIEFITLAESFMKSVATPFSPTMTRGAVSTWFRCSGGIDAAREHLGRLVKSNLRIGPGFEGASEVHLQPSVNGALINSSEKWSIRFLWEPSVTEHGDLFYQLESRHLQGGRYETIEERRKHVDSVHDALLAQAGFEITTINSLEAK